MKKPALFSLQRITALGCGFAPALMLTALSVEIQSDEPVNHRPSIVFENPSARLVLDLNGGSIGEFRLHDNPLNPLHWSTPEIGDGSIHGFGHFLCLDRWGPPSDAEGAKGMPYHGESANVQWKAVRAAAERDGFIEGQMTATLPKAGLSVRRTIRMSSKHPAFAILEEVTNENALGRIYNMVQHPSIGPPFLDEGTVVDCSGRRGFAQGGTLPTPEEPSFYWPQAINAEGEFVNLRRLTDNPAPNVVSFSLDGAYGWITAATSSKGLLLGYLWLSKDYPWVSVWRDVRDGRPAARGLEFGTTGLHQPFPILVKKSRIWDRPLFEYLDAGETTSRSYLAFLLPIPANFAGVDSIVVAEGKLIVHERATLKPREFSIDVEGLIPR